MESAGVSGLEQYGITLAGRDLTLSLNTGLGDTATTLDWSGSNSRFAGDMKLDAKGQELIVAGSVSVALGEVMHAEGSARISLENRDVLIDGKTVATTGFYIGLAGCQRKSAALSSKGWIWAWP